MLFAYHKPVREIEVISSPQLSDLAGGLTLQNPPSVLSANNSGFTHLKL